MSSQRLLQQERNIRIAGLLLMLSPIGNVFFSILTFNAENKWTAAFFWQVIQTSSPGHWYLKIACIIVGAWMAATARRSSWLFALIVLGLYIGYGIVNFKSQKLMSGWFPPTLSLLSNIGFFAFIYFVEFQHSGLALEEEKRKRQEKEKPRKVQEPTTAVENPISIAAKPQAEEFYFNLTNLEGYVLDFEGIGPWGKIEKASAKEIHVRAFEKPPEKVREQAVEIILNKNQTLRFRFQNADENLFTFSLDKVQNLDSFDLKAS